VPHHPKMLTKRATSSCLNSQMASGSKTKESSNYRVYFERIFKLKGLESKKKITGGKQELAQITGG
jgi:hypothetical protein